ncbi:MAG TPA: hypothetical protein VN636_01585, partial [Acidimicrobiia bacterium]|nr:hypothetical protein [Acidimicrobiia bacterium]
AGAGACARTAGGSGSRGTRAPAAEARAGSGLRPAQSSVPAGARLQYWGGRMLANVKVAIVVWGPGRFPVQVTSRTAPNAASFFATVTQSPYFDWLQEYDANGTHLGRGSVAGQFTVVPAAANNRAVLDDAAHLRPELSTQIRAGRLPPPGADTLYVVFTRTGQVVTQGGADSVTGFCAYHSTFRLDRTTAVRYAVIPATAAGPHCGTAPGFANLTTAASHELVEAVTDPDVGLAHRVGPPLAWYDPMHGEIGDICAHVTATVVGAGGDRYTVQQEWSNRKRRCTAH